MRCAAVPVLLGSIGVGCTSSGPQIPPAPPAEVARINALADEMRAAARAADAKRTKALLAASAELRPRAELGRCPIAVPLVGTDDMARLGEGEPKDAPVDWRSIRADQMMVVDAADLATARSARLDNVEKMIEDTRSRLNQSNVADTEKWIRYYGDLNNEAWEMVVIATRRVAPELLGDTKFRAGAIVGRAFVYDHTTGTVVCAADVVAESSQLLSHGRGEPTAVEEQRLKMDLDNEAYREAAKALVRAGPIAEAMPAKVDAAIGGDAKKRRGANKTP